MQSNIAVSLKNISKTFFIPEKHLSSLREHLFGLFQRNKVHKFEALKDINVDIHHGEFFGILGRNGSGKSSLLKIISKIYCPDKGGVHNINGTISSLLELGVGFHPELTARENVTLSGIILGIPKKYLLEKMDDILNFAEVGEFADQKLKFYSSGMMVRLAFSVAIQANAEILILDEVFAVGDINFQAKCYEKFVQLRKDKKTVILVSHNIEHINEFCDRAMYLDNGQVVALGNTKDVTAQYLLHNQ